MLPTSAGTRAATLFVTALLGLAFTKSDGPAKVESAHGHSAGRDAFSYPTPGLSAADRRAFAVGNSFFKQNWVAAPSSAEARDGLGPLFNARSCSACHLRDGRSRPPEQNEGEHTGLVVRVASSTASDAVYGDQIQDASNVGVAPEARVITELIPLRGTYGDGTPFELMAPAYHLDELAYGALRDDVVLGGRTAPHLVGLGLLEAVPESAILRNADPEDRDGDGVSGRASIVQDHVSGALALGRFGWKASQPTVLQQTAAAFLNDMGITSDLFPDEVLTAVQRNMIEPELGGNPEIVRETLERVALYTRSLAVPDGRGEGDAEVLLGSDFFERFDCSACHVPCLDTAPDYPSAAFRGQAIRAYTDLLLHDLGPALADGGTESAPSSGEWRTSPLWGIGLIPAVSGHSRLLHDGRARDMNEAILWHGGEALSSRERFRLASKPERDALLAFLRSL
jgi:CxxC motif-containing protein (DUF1111 family)